MGICNAKELLKDNKLKVTKQRQIILEEIISLKQIFTANMLFHNFNKEMDLVTIYRVISALVESGVIREVLSSDEEKKYELACIHNPVHPHFKCRVCGELICLKALDSKISDQLTNFIPDYCVESLEIQFSGVCNRCK